MTQTNILSAAEISNLIATRNKNIKNYVAKNPHLHPHIYNRIVEVGVENIFYIGECYRSRYHDDYCTFFYWDNVLGEKIEDEWTTAAGCPNFDLYSAGLFTVEEAKIYGLYNKEAVINFACNACRNYINLCSRDYVRKTVVAKYNKLVKVESGRKWQGTGYLISIDENNYDAKILSLEDMQIHHCIAKHVQPGVDINDIAEKYNAWANKKLDEVIANNDFDVFFDIDGYDWKVKPEHRFSFENFVEDNYSTPDINVIAANAYDAVEEAHKKKEFAKIVEWVKNKTDRKGAEIEKLALHIFNKKYKNA